MNDNELRLRGYVVTKKGTFGKVTRLYRTEDGKRAVVIRWGLRGWVTPVLASECHALQSYYESEAWKEAEAWLSKKGNYGT